MATTQHKPGHEPKKAPWPAFDRLCEAAMRQKVPAFHRALAEVIAEKRPGLWPHRILGLVLRDCYQQRTTLVETLLTCARPPMPTNDEHFAGLALQQNVNRDCLLLLGQAGFRLRNKRVDNSFGYELMARRLGEGRWAHPDLLCPHFLRDTAALKLLREYMRCAIQAHYYQPARHEDHDQGPRGFFATEHVRLFLRWAKMSLDDAGRTTLRDTITQGLADGSQSTSWRSGAGEMAQRDDWQSGMNRLIEAGLIDLPTLAPMVRGQAGDNSLMALVQQAQARMMTEQMELETAPVIVSAPRAARL